MYSNKIRYAFSRNVQRVFYVLFMHFNMCEVFCIFSEDSLYGEEASILRSLTGKRKLDSVGNDVQIWELSPSTSPLPTHYGRGEHERFSFFSHSPIDNIEKGPSSNPNITEALMDMKEKSSMRLLGQLDAIVNRNNTRIFGIDGAINDNQEGLAGKHKMNDVNENQIDELPIKAVKKENNFRAFDETVENILDAPTPVDELSKTVAENIPDQGVAGIEGKNHEMTTEKEKEETDEGENDKPVYFMEVDTKEAANKNDTDKNDMVQVNASDAGDIWEESMELVEESEMGREGSPGSSPASPRRGNFRSKLRGGRKTGNSVPTKFKMSSFSGFENGGLKAKEKVKSPRKAQALQPISELESSNSPMQQVLSTALDLQIAASGPEISFVNSTSHDTNTIQKKNATPERSAGGSNITVNDHAQQQMENIQAQGDRVIEPSPGESNTSSNDEQNKNSPGTDPSNANNTNTKTLVNVLRQRVRSIRAAEPVTAGILTAGIPVGSPTPFMIVSPVGSPLPVHPLVNIGAPSQMQLGNEYPPHIDINDNSQVQKVLGATGGMVVSTNSTISSDTNIPVTSSNSDLGSTSAMVEGFTPDGTPSTATTTTSVTSSSIHSQPSSSETSISHLAANSLTLNSNLPPSNSEQTVSVEAPDPQENTATAHYPVGNFIPDSNKFTFTQGYVGGSNSVAGIPFSTVTSGIPVSVVGGRVIGPGGLPITGPGGVPITIGLNGSGGVPRGSDLFLMQGIPGINLDKSLLGPEDLLAMDMHPTAGIADPAVSNSSGNVPAAGVSGGSPDTAAQVCHPSVIIFLSS